MTPEERAFKVIDERSWYEYSDYGLVDVDWATLEETLLSEFREAVMEGEKIGQSKLFAGSSVKRLQEVAYQDAARIARETVACAHGEGCHRECDCPVDIAQAILIRADEVLK